MTPRPSKRARAKTKPIAEKHRPTEGELTARIDTVYSLLISGTRRAEICQFASERWRVDERQADRYIAEATKLIKAEAEKDRAETFGEHIAYRRKLRKLAEGDKDWRAALASAQDEAKLLDLYPLAHNAPNLNLDLSKLNVDQLIRIANGEDPLGVLASASASGVRDTPTPSEPVTSASA